MNRPGFLTNSVTLCFRLWRKVFRPLAFSMMPLSIMVMTGATRIPAAPAAMASTPTLRPSFAVFHACLSETAKGVMSVLGISVGRYYLPILQSEKEKNQQWLAFFFFVILLSWLLPQNFLFLWSPRSLLAHWSPRFPLLQCQPVLTILRLLSVLFTFEQK